MSNSSVDNLADAILQELENYSESVTEDLKKAVDVVAKEVNEEIKKHITFNEPTGKYVKAFKVKKTYESKFSKGKTWYVSGGEYRLAHLLEKGHVKIGGGRTRAFPHIIFGEELAKKRMEELAKEAIENAGH
jgi:hypothetical protein